MADRGKRKKSSEQAADEDQSIFDLFEPPPDPDGNSFGKIPVVSEDEIDLTDGASMAERKAAADAEAAGLQHWTAPPTGQVPAVLSSESTESGLWGDVKGPSWHGDDPSWAGPDLADVFADTEAISVDNVPRAGLEDDEEDDDEYGDFDRGVLRPVAPVAAGRARPPRAPVPGARPPAPEVNGDRLDFGSPDREPPAFDNATEDPRRPGSLDPDLASFDPPAVEQRRGAGTPRPPGSVPPSGHPVAPVRSGQTRDEGGLAPGSRRAPQPRTRPGRETAAVAGRGVLDNGAPVLDDETAPPVRRRASLGGEQLRPEREPQRPAAERFEPAAESVGLDDRFNEEYDAEIGLARPGGRDLPKAIAVGLALVAILVAATWFGPDTTMLLVGGLALLAVLELFNAMRMAGLRPATLLGLVATVAAPTAAYFRGDAAFPLIVGMVVIFGALWYLVGADTERPVLNLSLTMMGILWVGGLASFGALILRFDGGIQLLIATIVITVASDTMAYVGGRAYGARPFHSASPNKTWEGTLTGFAAAIFTGFAIGVTEVGSLWDENFMAVIVLGAVVGVLAPIGDLAESLVKRDLGVKDMGTLLPGHGGVLDRLDGLLFALPGAYYLALVYSIF